MSRDSDLSLIGYADPWSARPGERVRVMVRDHGERTCRLDLVRLVGHGAPPASRTVEEEVPAFGRAVPRRAAELHGRADDLPDGARAAAGPAGHVVGAQSGWLRHLARRPRRALRARGLERRRLPAAGRVLDRGAAAQRGVGDDHRELRRGVGAAIDRPAPRADALAGLRPDAPRGVERDPRGAGAAGRDGTGPADRRVARRPGRRAARRPLRRPHRGAAGAPASTGSR
jgi:hypothetical protein